MPNDPSAHDAHDLPLVDRLVNQEISEWLSTAFAIAHAGTGTMNPEERAQHKMIDQIEHLHLADYWYTLTPRILGALRRSGQLREDHRQ